LYADIAHPINQPCRDMIQAAVIREYQLELERAKLPGYKSRYDDDYFEMPLAAGATAEPSTTNEPLSAPGPPKPHFPDAAMRSDEAAVPRPQSSPDAGDSPEAGFGKGILEAPQ
jgi:stage V sporulation protein G